MTTKTTPTPSMAILPKDAPLEDRIVRFLEATRYRDTTIAGGLGEPVCNVIVALAALMTEGKVRCGVLDDGEPVFEAVKSR